MRQLFASDNASAAHPAVIQSLLKGREHLISYGDDPVTAAVEQQIRALFDRECGVYFVYNGTGANVSALQSMARSFEAVICSEMAHINEDEGGAPEAIGGFKLLPVHRADGRLRPEDLRSFLSRRGFEHTNQPAVVSLTQATEVGTVYWPEELRALTDACHQENLSVHMDGARISNAAVAVWDRAEREGRPFSTPAEALRQATAGVDVLSFGATKNGLMFGEAVVFFDRAYESTYRFFRKQTTQLHSKMRYITGQFGPYLEDDLWFHNARTANHGAQRLSAALQGLPGFHVAFPTEANGVFVDMPVRAVEGLQEEFGFYLWNSERNMARLMVSWDTTEETLDRFVDRARDYAE